MLNMDYYDRNGDKWSIDKGDWLGYQTDSEPVNKRHSKINLKGLILFILVTLVALSCIIYMI